jgi:hypothetical protein
MIICNTYLGLSIISIILIISIIILILYKNHKDSKVNNSHTNTNSQNNKKNNKQNNNQNNKQNNKEYFTVASNEDEIKIISNNNTINSLISQLNNIRPQNFINDLYKENEENIDKTLQNNINTSINQYINNIKDSSVDNNNILDKNIINLENKIIDLENVVKKLNLDKINEQNYSKIKSLNNGQEFALTQTPNTKYINPETGTNMNGYMINMNNGCLSVGTSDYDIYKCNDKNQKHLFTMEHIINEQAYEKNIDKAIPFDNIDKSKVIYPFTMIKSVNNKNCLTNQNGSITVQPCYSFKAQRWMPF